MSQIETIVDTGLEEMNEAACYQSGVFGFGIVSNILNHMYPRVFPGNYKKGIFSLLFLTGRDMKGMILNIWELCVNRALRMSKAPDRSIFYVQERKLDDELKAEIISDQEKKKVHRVAKFEEFVSSIEAGDSAEMLVRKALNIGE